MLLLLLPNFQKRTPTTQADEASLLGRQHVVQELRINMGEGNKVFEPLVGAQRRYVDRALTDGCPGCHDDRVRGDQIGRTGLHAHCRDFSVGVCQVLRAVQRGDVCRGAPQNIANSVIDELIVTDTIPLTAEMKAVSKVRQLTLSEMLAECIRRISNEESISSMFD